MKHQLRPRRDTVSTPRRRAALRRRGVSLVELLVVLFIASILLGLILPAVQAARQASQGLQCRNQLRQLGLGLLQYEQVHQSFPPGKVSDRGSGGFIHAYWMLHILPMIEQPAIYDASMEEFRTHPNALSPVHHATSQIPLAILNCPSDGRAGSIQTTRRNIQIAVTSYVGCLGTELFARDGILYRDSRTRAHQVTDGMSNTLLLGERPPSSDCWYGWWYAGYGQRGTGSADGLLGTAERPMRADFRHCTEAEIQFQRGVLGSACDVLHYWSFHPQGANFCMADGSVKLLTYSGREVLPKLGTRAGGETVAAP